MSDPAVRPLVIVESPFRSPDLVAMGENIEYARRAVLDCIRRGETPFASHLFYTQVLNDEIEGERNEGIELGFVFKRLAAKTVVYTDRGISAGMAKGIEYSASLKQTIEYRSLKGGEISISSDFPLTVEWKNTGG